MRIGITCRFQNSYFSGSSPQIACTLAKVFQSLGHSVTLLYPNGDKSWFIDANEESKQFTTKEWNTESEDTYDMAVEVTWSFPADKRPSVAKRVVYFQHYPPAFSDMESSVYMHNPMRRDFTNVTECWTWAHHDKQDQHYLEFLSGKPVYTLPFVWNFDAVDVYVRETGVPYWKDIAKMLDGKVTAEVPASLSWCARIVESNTSNCSHCIMPLNIVSEIRQTDPVRFTVHNGDHVINNAFFQSNVVKNLMLPDISGNFVPRVRLPDLCREKSFIVAHQRFRPIKGYLLDALYLGIPLIHNCEMLKEFGYKYELNLIKEGASKWRQMRDDYANGAGYFAADQYSERRKKLRERFGPQVAKSAVEEILKSDPAAKKITRTIADVKVENEIRVAFCDMWDQFHPEHNFFMSLLKWAGAQHGFKVSLNYPNPNLVIYGPFGDKHKKFKDVPKVFFTGENAGPRTDEGTFLNLGYQYRTESNYVRLPLWVLEINWFGEDPEKIVNPKPVPLTQCLKQDESVLNAKKKFCAFVATNPKCQNRNVAFQILNQWRPVDSGGRLFCNLPGGPIPAGLGGGGGEHSKLEFYKKYKYAITFENETAPGYTTEKLFHAKVAGCVPIYWGDKFVDRDFDQKGFLNANTVSTPQELIALIENLEKDPEAWKAMASVPALSEYKRHWCEKTMEQTAKQIIRKVLDRDIAFAEGAWKSSESFHKNGEKILSVAETDPASASASASAVVAEELKPAAPMEKRLVVTATNKKFVSSAVSMIRSLKKLEPATAVHVYTWADVDAADETELRGAGANEIKRFPVDVDMGWPDFWEPQHFAWKSWVQAEASRTAPDDFSVLYIDAGIEIVCSLDRVWSQIATHEFAVLEDSEQINRRWCHPTFCKELTVTDEELSSQQILAGFVGFKARGKYYESVQVAALNWAKKRDVIAGEKWKPYSNVCMGHRHDQSILSVMTHRAKVPRLQHRDFYCDRSRRAAENDGLALYVHRGAPRSHIPVALGIDDAYVINLERRKDRIEQFRKNPNLKDVTSVWKATEGRKLTMNQDLARLFRNNDFKWKKAVMGCALSHMGLWKKLAEDPIAKTYLIMEDDVKFSPDWFGKWMGMASSVPADADVIYLGGILPPNKPAFPSIVEPVNKYFGRVAKNTLFGPTSRRYFHFCNYSYVLTQSGARKIMQLIAERGIFTSGDHMIVNHGDGFLNIYFTIPLLTECIQEEDPVYVKSDFNNFDRLDTFDSDLWNNNEHFSQEEVTKALAVDMQKIDIKIVDKPISDEELKRLNEEHEQKLKMASNPPRMEVEEEVNPVHADSPAAPVVTVLTKEEKIKLWNDFLRAVALRKSEDVESGITTIFSGWVTHDDVLADISWFRIFEQLILTDHPEILKHKQKIIDFVNSRAALSENIWKQIMSHLGAAEATNTNGVHALILKPAKKMNVFYLSGLDPAGFFEYDWFNSVFPHEIDWKATSNLQDLVEFKGVPVLLYMNPHGRNMTPTLNTILDVFKQIGKQLVIFHMSDEYARDDISVYGHVAVKHVIRNYWRAGLDREKVTVLPLGFAKGRSAHGLPEPPAFGDRPNMWSFVGSADRPGRMEALNELHALAPYDERVRDSWSSPMKAESAEYCDLLRKSKFVPCMKGAAAMESFRLYEALEHGAIPFYVPSESQGCGDEYREIFGTAPLMAVPSWKDAASFLGRLAEKADVMEAHRREVYNWWKQKKVEFGTKLKSVLEASVPQE